MVAAAKETFPEIDAVSIDEALKDIFVKGIADPRLRQKLDWKKRKMKDIRNQKFTIQDLILYARVTQQSFDSDSGSLTENERPMQICVTQQGETEQAESICLAELMKKMLNHYDEAAREREEKKRYFQSRSCSGFHRSNSQQVPQES